MPEQSAGGSLAESAAQPSLARPVDQETGRDGGVTAGMTAGAGSRPVEVEGREDAAGVAFAIETWRRALTASGLPDTLVASGPSAGSGGLDLTQAHPSGLAQLFAGRQTRLSSLFRESDAHAAAWRQARAIRSATLAMAAQRGVQGCCLAVGVAGWTGEPGGTGEQFRAPVVLRACTVRPRGGGDFDLELDEPVLINPELVRWLQERYDVEIDGPALAALAEGPKGFDPRPVYAWLEEHGAPVPGFAIERRLLLATVASGFGALLADLDAAAPAVAEHRLLGQVARSLAPSVLDLTEAHRRDGVTSPDSPPDPTSETSGDPSVAPSPGPSAGPSAGPSPVERPDGAPSGRIALASGRVEDLVVTPRPGSDAAAPPPVPADEAAPEPPAEGETRRLAMVGRLAPRGVRPVKPPPEPDPAEDLLVLDLDPAQRAGVEAVMRGDDVLIEGPPGSGVTHTLAAAVARLVAAGRSVLVLSPRRASTENLLQRLISAGVADLVLDLRDAMGAITDPAATATRLLAALDVASGPVAALPRPGRSTPDDAAVETLRRSRILLDGEVEALHEVREPWGVSAYDAMIALAELSGRADPPGCPVRLGTELLREVDAATRERLRVHLRAAAEAEAFTLGRDDTRWADASVSTATEARAALEAALLLRAGLERARTAMDSVANAAGLHSAHHASGWLPLLELLLGVRRCVDAMVPAIYEHDLDPMVAATAPRARRAGFGLDLSRGERRRLRRQANALVRPGVHVPDLHGMLLAARDQKVRWSEFAILPELPRVVVGLSEAEAAVRRAMAALDVLAAAFEGSSNADPRAIPLDDLEYRVHDLAGDRDGILGQPRRATLVDGLRRAGLGAVVDDFRARRVGPDRVDAELDQLWWASVWECVVAGDPRLGRRDPLISRQAAADLRAATGAQVAAGAGMVRSAVTSRAAKAVARHGEQVETLRRELTRPDRRPWLAELVREAGDVLSGLAPIWLMNLDTAATCLAPADPALPPIVDVVVLDDAGYVGLPEVAAALARGAQVVLGGDRRRQAVLTGPAATPSVAAAASPFATVCRLDRDHRVVDGRILTPLVSHYREGWQLTPGVEALPPLMLEPVADGMAVPPPGEELPISADAEVNRVVDLVEAHAVNLPEESLVVLTLGERHAERIEEALRSQADSRPALARWLAVAWQDPLAAATGATGGEPFLVRPVQRALGVERDAAIVAIGVAKTPHGRVLHRFGPLDDEHGPSILIAALSRARTRTTVVSCFTAEDLVVERLRTPGGRLLRDVLLAAGGRTTARPGRAAGADGLVRDLRARLAAAGLPVHARVGDRSWPLDLALDDPRVPGRMLVALDVDGPGFASRSCGERERLRPLRWEKAGWTYRKVSALDYFSDPALEVERIRADWEGAMAAAPAGLPAEVARTGSAPSVELDPALDLVLEDAELDDADLDLPGEDVTIDLTGPAADLGPMVDPDPVEPAGPVEPADPPAPVDGPLPSDDVTTGPGETADDSEPLLEQTRDDTDLGWGVADPDAADDRDDELRRERPPHWD